MLKCEVSFWSMMKYEVFFSHDFLMSLIYLIPIFSSPHPTQFLFVSQCENKFYSDKTTLKI